MCHFLPLYIRSPRSLLQVRCGPLQYRHLSELFPDPHPPGQGPSLGLGSQTFPGICVTLFLLCVELICVHLFPCSASGTLHSQGVNYRELEGVTLFLNPCLEVNVF